MIFSFLCLDQGRITSLDQLAFMDNTMVNVLALPLAEGISRLENCGFTCKCKVLLPPRQSEQDYQFQEVRKYIVRQQKLSDTEVELTIVFR